MQKTCILVTALVGLTLATPLAAHHNCAAGDACPEEIGDMMGNHEAAIEALTDVDMGGRMDPADDPAENMADTATQAGGGADTEPALTRPNVPQASGGTQAMSWDGQ